ncbi:MAG: phage portal protein [Clostridia bacterium]|nr:phage portal protein [Clostridia bacterium]
MANERSMSAFLEATVEEVPNKEVVISKRFKDKNGDPIPFEIKPIPTSKIRKLRKSAMRYINGKVNVDIDVLNQMMVIESLVYPDLKNEDLQQKFGVMGEEALLDAMLLPGEFDDLTTQVTELCGYNGAELVEEAKN